jgi:hypothetical protein
MYIISEMHDAFQGKLFPFLQDRFAEPLTQRLQQLVRVLEVVRIEDEVCPRYTGCMGRPAVDRRPLARAFVAKSVYNLPTTLLLIEMLQAHPTLRRICGFERRRDIPSEATFSRAFAEFSAAGLCDRVLLKSVKTYVGEQIVGHVSYDATEIVAREKGQPKARKELQPKAPSRRGGPKRGAGPHKEPVKRLHRQLAQSVPDAIADLPRGCDWSGKLQTKGRVHYWKGYKAHIAWADDSIPLAMITTSASLHDSQVAIPLLRTTAQRATVLYDLMDSAYDAGAIHKASKALGHAPLINPNLKYNDDLQKFDPADARRYRNRTTAERGNSRFKDEFGARFVRVRGHAKVHTHLMFGLLALFADQLLRPCTR